MKVILFLIFIFADAPEPAQGTVEVKSVQECHAQLKKILQQPTPKGVVEIQAGCSIQYGEPT